jgi:hypothetical protein
MDPMQKLDRAIKILVAMITLAALALVGLRVVASRSLRPDPQRECEAVGRTFDTARQVCLPPATPR